MAPMDANPYAPPKTTTVAELPAGGCMADDRYLYITAGAVLPERCAVTNRELEEGDRIYTRKFAYTPPWVFLLILLNLIVMLIVALIVQKKVSATYWLSAGIRAQYRQRTWTAIALILASIATFFGCAQVNDPGLVSGLIFLGVIFILVGLIALVMANPLKVTGYKHGIMRIKGCSPDFLAALPRGGFGGPGGASA